MQSRTNLGGCSIIAVFLLGIAFIAGGMSDSLVATAKATVVEWEISEGGNGHFYEAIGVSVGISWTDANKVANLKGGYLVTITSQAENDFVHALINNATYWDYPCGPWIGGYQPEGSPEPAGGWRWVTDEPFLYSNWNDQQPNEWQGNNENRIHFGFTPRTPFWNDVPDAATTPEGLRIRGYIVEMVPESVTYYVDDDAHPGGNGRSWATAFNRLQDALAIARPCSEIRVAEGIYKPDQGSGQITGDRAATFQLKYRVTLKGSYAGFGQPDPDARDIEACETILSGDLLGNDGPDFANNGENSYHVVTGSGCDETTVLDGFTITGGNANGVNPNDHGGGMYNYSGSPTLINCTFSNNSAEWGGGGMFNGGSSPTVTDCTFSGNYAVFGGGMSNVSGSPKLTNCTFSGNWAKTGGGMFNEERSIPTLTNCMFSGNVAKHSSGYGSGGGMYNSMSDPNLVNCTFNDNLAFEGGGMRNSGSSPTLTNCTFSNNSVELGGGGMYNGGSNPTMTNCTFSDNSADNGGGMCNRRYFGYISSPTLTNCTFSNNSADNGGGMYNFRSDPNLVNCTFNDNLARENGGAIRNHTSNPTVLNCLIVGNQAQFGGAILNENSSSNPTLINCTFSSNSATDLGGGIFNYNSRPILNNCILWANSDMGGVDELAQIHGGLPAVNYCCIQGWTGSLGGMANINADPCFIQPGYRDANGVWIDGDYHLHRGSLCINAGDNSAVPLSLSTDLDGNPRIVGGTVDMGAYENYSEPITIYVEANAAGANNGSSWADAFNNLQDALAVAIPGDEIRVAQGIYKPDQGAGITPGDREAAFPLTQGVIIKGSFAGFGAQDPNERDFEFYETILTGDLNGDDIGELYDPNNTENSYHVITASRSDSNALLDGFTVIAGNANGDLAGGPHNKGGAVYNEGGSLKICNCKFIRNRAYGGGAIYNVFGSPKFINCIFEGNPSCAMYNLNCSPELINCMFIGNYGSGMFNDNSDVTLTSCSFLGNNSYSGGGMFNDNSNVVLTDCSFFKNSAKSMSHGAGGGMYSRDSNLILISCAFEQNWVCVYHKGHWTADGGGMYNTSCDITLLNCSFIGNAVGRCGGISDYESSAMLTDSIFNAMTLENHIAGIYNAISTSTQTDWQWTEPFTRVSGGGIFIYNSVLSAWNCTFAGNLAWWGGGMANYDSSPTLTNCILWGDTPGEISGSAVVTYSDIQGGWPGEGNIDADPRFVQPGCWDANGTPEDANDDYWIDGDHHLLSGSPCIDAGDPNYIAEPNETDLDGNPRIMDGDDDSIPVIDMGAYEFFNTRPVADAGPDQVVECACNTNGGTKVILDGTGSYDVDGDPLTYIWSGPFVESPLHGATPTVTLDGGCPGEYVISLVVNDGLDESEPNEVVITVVDTTPPEFILSVAPTMLWPPDHKMVLITPSWTVSDECDATPDVSLVSIVANEGDDTIGDGHTSNDIQINEDGSIYLRSERSGTSSDRVYTITYQAIDDCGNATLRSATVSIPHDFKVLARIASRWLWTNQAGNIPEDLNGDGVVNLKDIAIFANNWIQ